jgi:hypothetical protein
MATNPFFKDSYAEFKLLDDLTIETIKATGRDMIYIPREYFNKDDIFGEDTKSKFTSGYTIEMYIENVQEFGGDKDIATKFGIAITDRVSLQLSKTRFKQEVTNRTGNITRPREGDLVYMPVSGSLFEINFVEDERPFYQFGKLTTYSLSCELFTYSGEDIETGITEVDEVESKRKEYATKLTLSYLSTSGISGAMYYGGETIFQVSGVTGAGSLYSNATATGTLIEAVYGTTYNTLYLTDLYGTISYGSGMSIKGRNSGVEYYVTNVESTTIEIPKDPLSETAVKDNDLLQFRGNSIIDFTETDPFSEGRY